MDTHSNVLLCGYLRKSEKECTIIIPLEILQGIDDYCIKHLIFGIGDNDDSQLGLQSTLNTFQPLLDLEKLAPTPTAIYSNARSLLIITPDKELYVAGYNMNNRLHHQQTKLSSFTKIKMDAAIKLLSHGIDNDRHTFLQTVTGKLYASGEDETCMFGAGEASGKQILKEIPTNFLSEQEDIIDISCARFHTLFLTQFGTVYSCGSNIFARCGQGRSDDRIKTPHILKIPDDQKIMTIECGEYQSFMLDETGRLIVFGGNYKQMCGMPKQYQRFYTPTVNTYFEENGIKLVKAMCGDAHGLCLDEDGVVYTMGTRVIGIKSEDLQKMEDVVVHRLEGLPKVIDASAGLHHNLLISEKHEIISFGYNNYHQCSSIRDEKMIEEPNFISKERELGVNENSFVERVIAMYFESVIVINPNKAWIKQ